MCTTRRGTQQLYWIFKQPWEHIDASLTRLDYKVVVAYGAPTHTQVTMHFVVHATHRWHSRILLPLQLLLPTAITIKAAVTLDLDARLKIVRQVPR